MDLEKKYKELEEELAEAKAELTKKADEIEDLLVKKREEVRPFIKKYGKWIVLGGLFVLFAITTVVIVNFMWTFI